MKGYPEVRLGRTVVAIEVDDGLQRATLSGEASMDHRIIRISPKHANAQARAETLVHEILHVISERCGAKLKEKQVRLLEVGVSDFLAQNLPLIVRLSKELQ